jgi:hypothetical protein
VLSRSGALISPFEALETNSSRVFFICPYTP